MTTQFRAVELVIINKDVQCTHSPLIAKSTLYAICFHYLQILVLTMLTIHFYLKRIPILLLVLRTRLLDFNECGLKRYLIEI